MTLMAVDLNKNGNRPNGWLKIAGVLPGYQGYLIMTDEWFNEYMFRLVVETKYVPAKALEVLKQNLSACRHGTRCLLKKSDLFLSDASVFCINP